MASAAPLLPSLSVGGTDIICGDNVDCGGLPADPYRLYLTQFINFFVNGTIRDLQAKDRFSSEIPNQNILDLKREVFKVCTNHDFLDKLNRFNAFMKTAASIVYIGEDGNGTSIYELDTPRQTFYIGERAVDSRVVSLYITGFTLHKFLQDPSFTIHIPQIHMSDLNTFRQLLPNREDLTSAYFIQRARITGFRSFTPDNDELIVLATNFFSNHFEFAANNALARTRIFMDDRVEREERAGPLETGRMFSFLSGGNFGLKKRNKSKRRNQKKSNKKSRRHRNRKRLSRRNAKRFY
jgi:hypothetical protein